MTHRNLAELQGSWQFQESRGNISQFRAMRFCDIKESLCSLLLEFEPELYDFTRLALFPQIQALSVLL